MYQQIILEATGCSKADLRQIEEVMRDVHPTMDHLTKRQLNKLAREAWEAVKELRLEGIYETP